MMNSLQNLHYAIGELAYAVAKADGKIQKEEHEIFHRIVAEELFRKDYDFDISEIIFQIMEKDETDVQTTYQWAMKEIKMNSQYLSPELKNTFIRVLEKVADAYPPVTKEEKNILEKFKSDITLINGDPVYFEKTER